MNQSQRNNSFLFVQFLFLICEKIEKFEKFYDLQNWQRWEECQCGCHPSLFGQFDAIASVSIIFVVRKWSSSLICISIFAGNEKVNFVLVCQLFFFEMDVDRVNWQRCGNALQPWPPY